MKTTAAALIIPLLSLLLGPAPKGYSPEELAAIFQEPSGVAEEDQGMLSSIHEDIAVSSHELADSILGVNGLLSTINALYSPQLYQTAEVSDAEQEAWALQMELILQQACKGFIKAVNLNEFLTANTGAPLPSAAKIALATGGNKTFPLPKGNTDPESVQIPQPQFAIITIAIGSAIVGSMYYLFSSTKENLDQAQLIVYQTADIGNYHRTNVINQLQQAGIQVSSNATSSQIWETFKAADYGKRRLAFANVRSWVRDTPGVPYQDDLMAENKQRFQEVTAKMGKVGTKVVVDSSLTVLNAGWSSLIPGELPGALVDIASVYYNAGPTDILEANLHVAAVSGNQQSLPIPSTTFSTDQAKQVLAELKEMGAAGVGGTELENALSAFGKHYAEYDLDDNPLTLSYPEYTFFPQVHLTQNTIIPEKLEGSFQIPEKYLNYFFDFLYTGSEGILEWFRSYHQSLNAQVAIPQTKEGEDDSECLQWKDGLCVVPGRSGYDPLSECGTDVAIADHQGNRSCLGDFLSSDPVEPKICPKNITTPDDWSGSSSYVVEIRSLTGTVIAQCGYMKREHCDGSASDPDLLTSETMKTGSGSTSRGWVIYDEYNCGLHFKNNLNMYDNTYDPYIQPSGRHGLQVEYHGHYSEWRTTPSPCQGKPRSLGYYSNNLPHGTLIDFICDEATGTSYLSSVANYSNWTAHGLFQSFYPDTHTLAFQANYINDNPHGLWEEFYQSGILQYSCQYNSGAKDGDEWSFHPDGSPSGLTQYNNDLMDGFYKIWDQGNPVPTICDVYSQGSYFGPCP